MERKKKTPFLFKRDIRFICGLLTNVTHINFHRFSYIFFFSQAKTGPKHIMGCVVELRLIVGHIHMILLSFELIFKIKIYPIKKLAVQDNSKKISLS